MQSHLGGVLGSFIGAALLLLPAPAAAQTGVAWAEFSKQPSQLAVSPLSLSDTSTQAQFAIGDLDKDGWDDVVAVRKETMSVGKRRAFLLLNENGVLTDATAQYATASDVPGDLGFNQPTTTTEAAIVDVDNDTWLDVVTSVAFSDGDPKVLSHPRVYVNLGADGSGNWLGLRFENSRMPQLTTIGGLAVAPRFIDVAAGDVTGDGFADLYFVDADSTGFPEVAGQDLNDRLLVNDGNGFFFDASLALTLAQLQSAFGADVECLDLNADGLRDIVKVTAAGPPTAVRALYNSGAGFASTGISEVAAGSPWGVGVGNLNNDALVDVAIADDGADGFKLGTGLDGSSKVVWSGLHPFQFVSGGDDGTARDVQLADLDGNGWNDVLITSVNPLSGGCSTRLHVYHNLGTVPGDMSPVLKEESELASGSFGAGWKGVVGMTVPDLRGTYDVGVADFDKDGDLDMLVANCNLGTNYWQNEAAGAVCQADLGFAGPGSVELAICGQDLTQAGHTATLSLAGAAPGQTIFMALGLVANPMPLKGGTLVPSPVLALLTSFSTDGTGGFSAPITAGAGAPTHIIMQCVVKNGAAFEFSNAVDLHIGL